MANTASRRVKKAGSATKKKPDSLKKGMEVALRLIRTLEVIPKEPPRRTRGFALTTEQIADSLGGHWRGQYFSGVSMRTVQRYLEVLKPIFEPSLVSERRDFHYGTLKRDKHEVWYWSKSSAPFNIPKMMIEEAIALNTTRKFLLPYLPNSVIEHLTPYLDLADETLDNSEKDKQSRRWSEKIRVAVPGQPFLKPTVDSSVVNLITEALLNDRQIRFAYKNAKGEVKTHEDADPLGIIYLGDISYLLATSGFNETVLQFSLHRIVDVTIIQGKKAEVPAGFDIDTYIKTGNLGVKRRSGKATLELEARFRGPRSKRFEETPLTKDQEIVPSPLSPGWIQIKATVNNTEQLRWWLLGYGKDVEVLKPTELRKELAAIGKEMADTHRALSTA